MSENSLEALVEQGNLKLENKQYEAALATFERADSLFPDNAELKFYLGVVYYGLEQYETALEFLDRALAIDPQYFSFKLKIK